MISSKIIVATTLTVSFLVLVYQPGLASADGAMGIGPIGTRGDVDEKIIESIEGQIHRSFTSRGLSFVGAEELAEEQKVFQEKNGGKTDGEENLAALARELHLEGIMVVQVEARSDHQFMKMQIIRGRGPRTAESTRKLDPEDPESTVSGLLDQQLKLMNRLKRRAGGVGPGSSEEDIEVRKEQIQKEHTKGQALFFGVAPVLLVVGAVASVPFWVKAGDAPGETDDSESDDAPNPYDGIEGGFYAGIGAVILSVATVAAIAVLVAGAVKMRRSREEMKRLETRTAVGFDVSVFAGRKSAYAGVALTF